MNPPLLLGAIADDFTGAADLAGMLSRAGVRTALVIDSDHLSEAGGCQALVMALKTRSIPPDDARAESLAALETLQGLGARQVYFKYCSTFDSSREGNIGPVADALMDRLEAEFTVAVPALPENGRTLYQGYLFVGDRLISETHMREHPVHPMTEPNLVRHLQPQTRRKVGLIDHRAVRSGPEGMRAEMERLREDQVGIALVDVVADEDLLQIAEAFVDLPLVTGGSGLGWALPEIWKRRGELSTPTEDSAGAIRGGRVLLLSGSCSQTTLEQLADFERSTHAVIRLDVERLADDFDAEVDRLFDAASEMLASHGSALVASSADAKSRAPAAREVGALIESAHAALARRTVENGAAEHVVVAGGETSGAVAKALKLGALEVVEVLDPGVPILRPAGGDHLTVTFKSGNFGSPDFFSKALRRVGGRVKEAV